MIEVKARIASGDLVLEVKGHAESVESGPDPICAAVSGIMQATIAGLQVIAHQHPNHVRVEVDDHQKT